MPQRKRRSKSKKKRIGRKRPHPGDKCLRDQPVNRFGEKKKSTTISITPTTKRTLDELSIEHQCESRSELLELIGHRELILVAPELLKSNGTEG